jgi:hypothetical protein
MTDSTEKIITGIGLIAGAIAIEFGQACARAWLLSLVVALFAPAIVITFWQWLLVVVTIRFMFTNLETSKK